MKRLNFSLLLMAMVWGWAFSLSSCSNIVPEEGNVGKMAMVEFKSITPEELMEDTALVDVIKSSLTAAANQLPNGKTYTTFDEVEADYHDNIVGKLNAYLSKTQKTTLNQKKAVIYFTMKLSDSSRDMMVNYSEIK